MSKEANSQLSDEFKKEIREKGGKKNILGTILAILAIVLVFGTIGVAGYELVFKPEQIQEKSANEKIESRPESAETPQTPAATTPAPAATTPTTPAAPATTPAATTATYTVASGDTWSSIANANGMSSATLMKYNNATTEDLQIGQVIKIPKS
jgi:LysM repeat protein